jgi:para-nitrobenzyl esterase
MPFRLGQKRWSATQGRKGLAMSVIINGESQITLDTPIAKSSTGDVQGRPVAHGLVFRGIPFAEPPVGDLRYRPPRPAKAWQGVRDCGDFGPVCAQDASNQMALVSGGKTGPTGSEDCLYLNVWTPALDSARRPTMVFIHGGGFLAGGGSQPWYDGEAFARDDVVLVTVNYRLHALGFLFLDELFEGAEATGNLGVLDQIAALHWVRDNIAAFGGDPDNVTVFGQSAGAMSVGSLLATPAAKGLFRRAILQSGAAHNNLRPDTANRVTRRVLELLDVPAGDWDALRAVPCETIVKAANQVGQEAATLLKGESPGGAFAPVIDGVTRSARSVDLVAGGAAAGLDLLLGSCADEWRVFIFAAPEPARARLEAAAPALLSSFGEHAGKLAATYRQAQPQASDLEVFTAVKGDQTFTIPAVRLAEAQSLHHANVFLYRFSWRSPVLEGALGACHVLDVPFVFETLDRVPNFVGDHPPRTLAAAMHGAWIRFARNGDPNGPGLPDWPPYDRASRSVMNFDEPISLMRDPAREKRLLWDELLQ